MSTHANTGAKVKMLLTKVSSSCTSKNKELHHMLDKLLATSLASHNYSDHFIRVS